MNRQFHPSVIFIYYLLLIAEVMFTTDPIIQLTALIGGAVSLGRLPGGKTVMWGIIMAAAVVLTNPLLVRNGSTPLFFLNGKPVTAEALSAGISLALSLCGMFVICMGLNRAVDSDSFVSLFAKATPKLALVVSMTFRLIPLFVRRINAVSSAAKAQGLMSSRSLTDRIKHSLLIFRTVFMWSLENAMDTASSMTARGYGSAERTAFTLIRFGKSDTIFLAAVIASSVPVFTGEAVGALSFSFYPVISPLMLSPLSFVSRASFGVLVLLPFGVRVLEKIKWNYYISKI